MTIPDLRSTPLRRTPRGYIRQLGKPVQKFYLGHDPAIAAQRRQWIESIYLESCRVQNQHTWSDTFLDLARQVARLGTAVLHVGPAFYFNGSGPDHSFIHRLRQAGVPVSLTGEAATAQVELVPNVTPTGAPAITKLHVAIDEYKKDRIGNYPGSYQGSKTIARKIEKFYEVDDCWLWQVDHSKIKSFVDKWRGRPVTARGKRCSSIFADVTNGEWFKFLRWAEATYPQELRLPNLKSIDRSIPPLPSDLNKNSIMDHGWNRAELKEVFKTANRLTKLIIALGLNACAGAAELGRIKVADFLFDKPHPHANIIRYHGTHNWLITTRRKAYTHSEALLWDWVADLVREQVDICRANGWTYLFTEDGEPMYRDNEIYAELELPLPNTTKPESRFVKRYSNAVNLAYGQKRVTKKRSLGQLRKTFSNFLTIQDHADLSSLALAHATDADMLLKHYANKPYSRLFKATLEHAAEWKLT